MVRTDGDCHVLFFGIDGRLYNNYGDLIADAIGTGCQQCISPGIMEMVAVPVPGECGLYFILTAMVSSTNANIQVSLLDMNQPNLNDPSHQGRLLNVENGEHWAYAQFNTSAWAPEADPSWNLHDTEYEGALGATSDIKGNAPMIRVIDPDGTGAFYWMYVIYTTQVDEYRIDGSGIHETTTVPIWADPVPFGFKSYQRDASVAMTTTGEIRLAVDDAALNAVPFVPTPPQYSVLLLKFNSANGAFNGVQALLNGQGGFPDFNNLANTLVTNTVPGVGLAGPAGLALVNDATKLVVTGWAADAQQQLWLPVIGVYDLSANVWTDLLPTLNIQGNLPDFVRSRLYRNVSPTGTPDGLYLPLAGALGCITGVDDGTYAFTNPVGTQATVTPPIFSSGGGSLSVPYFINAQITHDPSVALYNAPACCATRSAIEGYAGYTFPNVPGTYTWTATENPFGNCPEVLFLEDLIIPAGVHLNIDGMHLKFAPTAHMILRAGAYVDADHSAFTPEDCLGVRWQGIRVEGVPTNLTQNGTVQGQLWLDDCLVEEAHVGIWCGREGDPDHGGGFVKCYNSSIRDCIVGARIMQYHRIVGNTELANKCSFLNTRFEVTLGWPDLSENLPKAQLHVADVNGVGITRCAFTNDFPVDLMPPTSRGVGILSFDASYRCKGFSDYVNNRFEGLHAGIVNILNDPLFANSVDGMAFDRNLVGIYDMACTYSIVKNNHFTAMTSTTPLNYVSMGMYIDQSVGYLVERNVFQDIDDTAPQEVGSVGIWFHGEQPADNRIYDNDFHDLTVGNVAQGIHHGGNVAIKTGLQWLCGLYEGEVYDQFLLSPDGTIRETQGNPNPNATAGNVFAGPTDCSTKFEPVVFANHDEPYVVSYYFYENDQSLDNRPECVEDANGVSLSSTGYYYDLAPVFGTLPFDPAQHCNGGILDAPQHSVAVHMAAYQAKYAELLSTAAAVAGQLDNGEKEEVLDAIQADPVWPSHQLRSFLLLRSPLSEEAIIAAIQRQTPMDPWHLTQVLIANSRLSGQLWAVLDHADVLSPFFYNLVREHQQDSSFREVLIDELRLRSDEKEMAQRMLVYALQEDSTYSDKLDTLLTVFGADSMGSGRLFAYQLALAHGRTTEVGELAALLTAPRFRVVLSLGDMQAALGYNWMQAGTAEIAALSTIAESGEQLGRGAAWGILYELGITDSLPNGALPFGYRNPVPMDQVTTAIERPIVGAYPNPAKDRLMITYPVNQAGATLELLDARGRAVFAKPLSGSSPFVEIDVQSWADGLYLARVLANGVVVGEAKCAIAR
jgi:hypothetical protein